MKKIDIKKLLFYILVPLVSGAIVGIVTSGDMKSYNGFVRMDISCSMEYSLYFNGNFKLFSEG